MDTIFDYLRWRGDLTMDQAPFNEVDALILARLSYLDFSGFVSSSFEEAGPFVFFKDIENVPDMKFLMDKDRDLIKAAASSSRFGDMCVTGFRNRIDEDRQLQFSAVTFLLHLDGNTVPCVSYRGTDSTFVGWKEDFNMSLMDTIPAQDAAVKYLEEMASHFHGPYIVTGHSKGGNLAVYAPSHASEEIRKRLISVYNFDGPGFTEENISFPGYGQILDKIHTYVPQTSVIGMLLSKLEEPVIIHSDGRGIYQHDLYSWQIDVTRIGREEEHTFSGRVVNDAFTMWLADLDMDEREVFFNTIYEILNETDKKTLRDLSEQKIRSTFNMLRSFRKLDDDKRRKVFEVMTVFLRMVASNIRENINN